MLRGGPYGVHNEVGLPPRTVRAMWCFGLQFRSSVLMTNLPEVLLWSMMGLALVLPLERWKCTCAHVGALKVSMEWGVALISME